MNHRTLNLVIKFDGKKTSGLSFSGKPSINRDLDHQISLISHSLVTDTPNISFFLF